MVLPLLLSDDFTLTRVAIFFGHVFVLHQIQTAGDGLFEFGLFNRAIEFDTVLNKLGGLIQGNLLVLVLIVKLYGAENLWAKHFAYSILQPFRLILRIAEAGLTELLATFLISRLALDPRIVFFVANRLPYALLEVWLLRCFAEDGFDFFATALELRL